MNRLARLAVTVVAASVVVLLAGCETDPYMIKYQQAANGVYNGPPIASTAQPPAATPSSTTGGYHPWMYYGYSTYNTPMATLRDDSLAGTFRVPFSTTGAGAVGYQPTIGQMRNGMELGVRSGVVPPN